MRYSFIYLLSAISPLFVSALTYKGADISSVAVVEAAGITYKDTSGTTGKLENILKTHGANTVRIRLWTSGQYNTAYGLALAKVRTLPSFVETI